MIFGTIRKGLLIIVSVALLRLMAGCIFNCDCPTPEVLDLNYNKAIITSVNNADSYISFNPATDLIPAKAIGFEIILTDTLHYEKPDYGYVQRPFVRMSFFNEAYAWDCDCLYFEFRPIKKMSSIHVRTLFDFSPDYKAGSDMTDIFVGYISTKRGMYSSLDDIISYSGSKDRLFEPTIDFSLFLKQAPTTDSLKFEITFEFDDNSFVTDSTAVVYPIY